MHFAAQVWRFQRKLERQCREALCWHSISNGGPAWEELTEDHRNANRASADHMDVKLRAISALRVISKDMAAEPFAFTGAEVELLEKMEHRRWCTERWLAGWVFGPRDDERKYHPSLIPWEALSESEREKDREQVRNVLAVLSGAGFAIVRQPQATGQKVG